MSSPLFSALEKLDDSLHDVQAQVEALRAGLEVSDDQLLRSLSDAHQNAMVVRDRVHAERPTANWNDRNALEQLLHDLEKEAQIKLMEQRRSRLLELAHVLEAGSVRHRFEARASTLNALRMEAVRELRIAAALPEQQKELPGPEAGQWLHWACNLLEESDFTELRADFPALEEFAVEMEESYWVPGEGGQVSAQPAAPAARGEQDPTAEWNDWQPSPAPSISDYRKPPHNVRVPSEPAVQSGGYGTAVALGYDTQSSTAPALAEAHWATEAAMPWQSAKAMDLDDEPAIQPVVTPPLKVCEKCGKTYSNGFHACVVDQATLQVAAQAAPVVVDYDYPSNRKNGKGNGAVAVSAAELGSAAEAERAPAADSAASEAADTSATDPSHENAEMEFHRLRAIMEQRSQDALGHDEEENLGWNLSQRQIIGIVIAVCVVLGAAIYAVVHYYSEKSVEAAASVAAAAAKVPVIPPDADLQKDIEQKLTALKNSTIEVAVQAGVVTLSGKSTSEEESVQAEDLSLQTTGVKVVRDRIQVDTRGSVNGKPRAGKPAQQH